MMINPSPDDLLAKIMNAQSAKRARLMFDFISRLDGFPGLSSGFRWPARRQDLRFDSGAAQLIGGGFHLVDTLVPAES